MTLLAGCGGGSSSNAASSTATSPANSQTSTSPAIVTPPTSLTVAAGQTATFNVVASGTSPLAYQWMSNGTAISGATSASYTTPATTAQLSGTSYDVVV